MRKIEHPRQSPGDHENILSVSPASVSSSLCRHSGRALLLNFWTSWKWIISPVLLVFALKLIS